MGGSLFFLFSTSHPRGTGRSEKRCRHLANMTVMINPICSVNLFSFIHSSLLNTYCVSAGTYSLRATEEGGFYEPLSKVRKQTQGHLPRSGRRQ